MEFQIRKMENLDKTEILSMMKEFYSSDAVTTNGSDEIFTADFEQCVNDSPYLDGYVFYNKTDILGYAMLAKSFSTEFGKPCIWFEDLYLKPKYRGLGIISCFINYIEELYTDSIFRLEVARENICALHVYKKLGYKELSYIEMKK